MPLIADVQRHDDGTLPAYAWPGGYPIYYVTADNGVLCPDCANRKNGSIAYTKPNQKGLDDDKQWQIVAYDVHWEGEPLICDHCNMEIESAYGAD